MTWAEEHGMRPCTATMSGVHVFAWREVKTTKWDRTVVTTERLACVCGESANEEEATQFARATVETKRSALLAEVEKERRR